MYRFVLSAFSFLAFVLTLGSVAAASTDRRVAFVVGNSAYQNTVPLANPRNDAAAVSEKLRDLGFVTVDGFDLTAEEFRAKIREFAVLASESDLAIFFYAGHGLAVNGTNYMVPVDAKFEDVTALDFEAISLDFITRQMEYSGGVNLLFLDACRNNPLAANLSRSLGKLSRSASVAKGLAEIKIENPGKGLAIAFATSPGEVAYDGDGVHSPFTTALLNNIDAPDTDITEVMSRVTGEVYSKTGQAQRPWLNTSLTGSVMLNAVAKASPDDKTATKPAEISASNEASSLEVERTVFQMARDSDRIEDYRAYLDTFPDGVFANFALRSIERLEKSADEPQQVAVLPTFNTGGGAATQPGEPTRSTGSTGTPDQPQQSQTFQLTAQQKTMIANRSTEQFLNADRAKRREVQARLNLSGHNVGAPDGSFGPKTRAGIQSWQIANGLAPSSFLNQPQYTLLVSQTQTAYVVWAAQNPAPVHRPRRTTQQRAPSNSGKSTQKSNSGTGISPGVGAFLGGVATGIIISN